MTNSVWPQDAFLEPDVPIHDRTIDVVTCFVALPSKPKEKWNEVYALIHDAATNVAEQYKLPLKCIRAVDIVSSGMIHPEIWRLIRTADIIICDVTGHNGNVILELGVAAAWRRRENVIILRDEEDDKDHLFDIIPARHLHYRLSYHGIQKLADDLTSVIIDALATYPFQEPNIPSVILPFEAKLTDGKDNPALYTEDITFRRMREDCLEFGSPLNYRHSWMSLGNLKARNVHVKATLKMTLSASNPNLLPFMGIMVRGSSYFSNFGHLVLIRPTGKIALTVRNSETGEGQDHLLGTVPQYDIHAPTDFVILINDDIIKISINGQSAERRIGDLGHVFTRGRILFIAGFCRVGVSNISVNEL